MWIKAAVLGGSGIIFSNLAVWTMAGLGITIAIYSSRKRVDYSNKKLRVIAREEDNNGFFDQLPDDILCNIASRLKLVEASRTTILSRRWRRIRTMNDRLIFSCLSTLDISKKYHDRVSYGDKQRFFRVVNQCLQLYSGRELKIFFMHCCFLKDHICHLEQWMQTLARLDVRQLYLGNSCQSCNGEPLDRPFTFSFKLIDGFSRLKFFDLTACYVETNFISQCNSLLSLDLRCIRFVGHELSDILSGCPNLTSLSMEGCVLPLNLSISGQNLKLENLIFLACHNVRNLEISLFNVMTIQIDICNQVEILLSSVPKLERLHLRTPKMNYRFGDVQRVLPQLKCLLVQTPYQVLRLPPTFQVFRKVRILVLMTRGHPCPKPCEEVDLWNFAPVLRACPLLEEFCLEVGGPVRREERNPQWPDLQHEHLYYMELSGFSNTHNELEFAKFILRSAQVLKRLRLRLSSRRFDGHHFYFEDEEDLKQIDDAQSVCASLQGHALSMLATVELF